MPYTAKITSSRSWLSLVSSPTIDPLVCGTKIPQPSQATLDGEFRQLAGDRVQMVVRSMYTKSLSVTFSALNIADMAKVDAWAGEFLLLRLTDGERLFGGYLDVQRTRYLRSGGANGVVYDAAVTFQRVSYQEAV